MGKNKDLDHFLTFKNSITLEHIKDYSPNRKKQKRMFEMLCSGNGFIQLGSPQTFSKTQFISETLFLAETAKTGLTLLQKYKSALKKPATRSFKFSFKIKRNEFFPRLAYLFALPLTIKDRKKLIQFLASSGLLQEDRNDYLDFSNFILLEKIDERYLDVFPSLYANTIGSLSMDINASLKFGSAFNKFLSDFIKNSRNRNILKHYSGLASGKKLSLKEISLKYRVSGKRAEQIIKSSLKSLSFNKVKHKNQQLTLGLEIRLKDKIYYELYSLFVMLFAILVKACGKVYIFNSNDNVPGTDSGKSVNCTQAIPGELFLKLLFVFRLLNIPVHKIAKTDTYLLGVPKETGKKIDKLIIKQDSKRLRKIIDPESLKKYIISIKKMFLSSNEIGTLVCSINDYLNETSQIREIVYAALKKIERPAHYSEITKICSTMFRERIFSSEQIHRSLSSKNQLWTWIGLRGVYALKEWGFVKPDKGLCQTVFEIVNSRFYETEKPVPFNHVVKEIGNYRKIVNENSLYFACNFNPRIKVVKKDLFIPFLKNIEDKKEARFLSELDKKFRKNL